MNKIDTEFKNDLSAFITSRQEVANRNIISSNPEYQRLNNEYNQILSIIKEKLGSAIWLKLDDLSGQLEAIQNDAYYLQGVNDAIMFRSLLNGTIETN